MESKSPQAERLSEDIQNNVPILLIIILLSICLYDKCESHPVVQRLRGEIHD
jgi:hypothetical protein